MNTAFLEHCADIDFTTLERPHIVPATWDEAATVVPYPHPQHYLWETLDTASSNFSNGHSIALMTPRVWQLESLAHTISRRHGLADVVIPPHYPAILEPFVTQCGIDILVVSVADMLPVVATLTKLNVYPQLLFVVHHSPDTLKSITPPQTNNFTIIHELQLVPGLPLLTHYNYHKDAFVEAKPLFTTSSYLTVEGEHVTVQPNSTTHPFPPFTAPFRLMHHTINQLYYVAP